MPADTLLAAECALAALATLVAAAAGGAIGVGALPLVSPLFGLAFDTNDLPEQIEIFTGPEGGFTDIEVQDAVVAGATAVSLGPTILRAETAPIVALAMVKRAWMTI